MKVKELKLQLRKLGLSTTGNKPILVDRLTSGLKKNSRSKLHFLTIMSQPIKCIGGNGLGGIWFVPFNSSRSSSSSSSSRTKRISMGLDKILKDLEI